MIEHLPRTIISAATEFPAAIRAHPLRAVTANELLEMNIPPREHLLSPILVTQSLSMLYAKRGVGKTHFALGLAYAIASGGRYLRYCAPAARKVLYIDGEMPASAMQTRLAEIAAVSATEPPDPSYLKFLTPDLQPGAMPDISTAEGQAAIEQFLDGVTLVVVDNLSTLARTGKENESEGWFPVQGWALSLRRRGMSVLFVHHAGKGGAQRGTSKREDVLDTIVRLQHSDDYSPEEGARFEVHIDKGRHLFGMDARPFEARLSDGTWTVRDLDDVDMARVVELTRDGLSAREIAHETGISKSRVNRMQKRAREAGRIE